MIASVPLTPREIEEEAVRIYGQVVEHPEDCFDEELAELDRLAEKAPADHHCWLPVLGGFKHA